MIPKFPSFTKIDPAHKTSFEEITKKFAPYSDHNFTSLLMWDINNDTEYSILKGNLVIKFKDYESDKRFYSFIGNNKTAETIEQIIKLSREKGYGDEVLLLPKDNFTDEQIQDLSSKYTFTEDRNNFDYILRVDELADFSGGKYLNKRNKLNHLLKNHQPRLVTRDISDQNFRKELTQCFNDWVEATKRTRGESFVNFDEIKAFKKLLDHHKYLDILAVAVYIDGKIQGFSLIEIVDNEYAHHPIQKGNTSYKGIYEFLYNSIGKYLKEKNIKYLNIYQDLGHEGLRRGKMDYNPDFLKKYTLSKKSAD